ncbi:MAG: hypothetical protein RIR11_3583 [Bacteroidota bacterium]|jgi:hypothetical protein
MNLSNAEKVRLKTKYGEWAIVTGASSGIASSIGSEDNGFARAIDKIFSLFT